MKVKEATKEEIRLFKKILPYINALSNGNRSFYANDNYIFELDHIKDSYAGIEFYGITIVDKTSRKHIESNTRNSFKEAIEYIENYETVC